MSKWTYVNVWDGVADEPEEEGDDDGVTEARSGLFGREYRVLVDIPDLVVLEWIGNPSLHIWVRHE